MDIRPNTWYFVMEDRPNPDVLVVTSAMQLPDSVLIRTVATSTESIFNEPSDKRDNQTSPSSTVTEVSNLKLVPTGRDRVTFKRLQQGEYPLCFPAE